MQCIDYCRQYHKYSYPLLIYCNLLHLRCIISLKLCPMIFLWGFLIKSEYSMNPLRVIQGLLNMYRLHCCIDRLLIFQLPLQLHHRRLITHQQLFLFLREKIRKVNLKKKNEKPQILVKVVRANVFSVHGVIVQLYL